MKKLYNLPKLSGKNDPLNGAAMGNARHEKLDPSTYRGLGSRTNEKERGRLAQLFYGYAKSDKEKLSLAMYNAAIKIYHFNADKIKIKKEKSVFKG